MMSKKTFRVGAVLAVLCFFFHLNTAHAYSISESDSVMQKIIYTSSLYCYEDGALNTFTTVGDFNGTINSLQGARSVNEGGSEGSDIQEPYYGFEGKSCNDLLVHNTANKFSSSIVYDDNSRAKILEGMAYSKTSEAISSNTDKCISYPYRVSGSSDIKYTEKVCAKRENGKWLVYLDETQIASDKVNEISVVDNQYRTGVISFEYFKPNILAGNASPDYHFKTVKITIPDDKPDEAAVFAHIGTELAKTIGVIGADGKGTIQKGYGLTCSLYDENSANNTGITCKDDSNFVSFSSVSGVGDGYQIADYDADSGRNDIVYKLSNGKWKYGGDAYRDTYSVRFSDMEKYILYTSYLKDIYGVTNKVCYEEGGHSGYEYEVKLWWEEKGKYSEHCYITTSQNQNKSVYGVYSDGYFSREPMNLQAMIAALNDLNLGDTPPTSAIIDNGSNDGSIDDGAISEGCYGAGLESQSWILCPTLTNMTSVVDSLDEIVGDMLSVDTTYFNQNNKTYEVWGIFRNIANTAMVVILLVIIFSQLTGYGIDNYGIKKMLPKLVLMAILINLSFFICELAIDLSNILGKGLDQMFRGIGNEIYDGSSNGQWIANIVGGVFGGAAAVGTAAPAISAVAGLVTGGAGPMVIISLILALLVALVAVLLFFLIIGARLMIIILFTAASPVAFACYILPNTQKIFKKWWDILKAALIVYPICGALYGLSYLIRGLVSNGSGASFPLLLVATVAPFLPFLVLPSLLKGAIAGLGAVSGAITSIGNGLRKGLSRGNQALQGTSAYKNQQEAQRRNMTRWRAGVTRDADGNYTAKNIGALGRALRGGKTGMASARNELIKNENIENREESLMGEGFEAAVINQQKAASAENIKDYMTLVNDRTNNGANEDELFAMYDAFVESGNKEGALAVAKVAGRRKDTAARFMKQKITGRGLSGDSLDKFNKLYGNDRSRGIFNSVNKEIAEGENAKNFRAAAPTAFEYSSSINKNGMASQPYEAWSSASDLSGQAHLADAINHGITNGGELVGSSADTLDELSSWVKQTAWVNDVSDAQLASYNEDERKMYETIKSERTKIIELAKTTYANKDKPGAAWDTTVSKVNAISEIAGQQSSNEFNVPHDKNAAPKNNINGFDRFGQG